MSERRKHQEPSWTARRLDALQRRLRRLTYFPDSADPRDWVGEIALQCNDAIAKLRASVARGGRPE